MAPVNNLLTQLAQHPELDRQAVLAVARQEGLSGGIGDGGHAFGPFQLNNAGGVITGRFPGQSAQQINQWAWSPQGIAEALQGISKVAGGLHGGQAVNAIVRRYERPADPNGEVARALSSAGGSRVPASSGAGVVGQAPQGPQANPHLLQILLATREAVGLPAPGQAVTRALQARFQPQPQPQVQPQVQPRQASVAPVAGDGGPRRLAGVDGIQVDPKIATLVTQLVNRFHVTPTSGYRNPAHNQAVGGAANSDHLRGDAVDFSGTPQALQALYQYAQGRFPYVEPMAQSKDHVHVSFRRP